ncbi:hypothetical protein DPMN_033176 [Dreissena polymorpha]|uniref:Uncharacterized protein n=1 Tax=Dreissena polymorpha TaxID=45954 RepID=A0A9D4RJL2_DREPO|nr:hypothetical protein DPMN_033176 [Dreissena polymorpha]
MKQDFGPDYGKRKNKTISYTYSGSKPHHPHFKLSSATTTPQLMTSSPNKESTLATSSSPVTTCKVPIKTTSHLFIWSIRCASPRMFRPCVCQRSLSKSSDQGTHVT